MPMSCKDSHEVSAGDRKFLAASVGALQSYKNDLEMAINYLASHETEASAGMMADCLKVTDALNTIITVYHEVGALCVASLISLSCLAHPSRSALRHTILPCKCL